MTWINRGYEKSQHSFPGQRQVKPEQLEIARLKREMIKLKTVRDIQKSRSQLRKEINVKFAFTAMHRGI